MGCRAPGAANSKLPGCEHGTIALQFMLFFCMKSIMQDTDLGAIPSITEEPTFSRPHLLLMHEVRQPAHIQLVRSLCNLCADNLQCSWIHIGGWLQWAKSSSRPEIKVMRAPYLQRTEYLSDGCCQQAEAIVRQVWLALVRRGGCLKNSSV